MDPRLLTLYNQELAHLREVGGEFAREYPKIAGRLTLDEFECADPYVERLLEGFAFLSARVQLKISASFPEFTQHLMEIIYPHYLAPTPSMAVVKFQPDYSQGSLVEGFKLPRGTSLRSQLGKGEQTPCEFRTAHEVTLWPIEIASVEYVSRDVASGEVPEIDDVRAMLRLRLRTERGFTFDELSMDELTFFLKGTGERQMLLYEQIFSSAIGFAVRSSSRRNGWSTARGRGCIHREGYDDAQSMLPFDSRSFSGYRLVHEYFSLPERFMFFRLSDLKQAIVDCHDSELEIMILFDQVDRRLDGLVTEQDLDLFCAPAINLFSKNLDQIHLDDRRPRFHLVPDRTRPMDFEVCRVQEVVGLGSQQEPIEIEPFYAASYVSALAECEIYFSLQRDLRQLSKKQRAQGPRSSYVGSEVFLSLVDRKGSPFRTELEHCAIKALCTNRDLPLQMPVGIGATDFTLGISAPVESIRCVAGPSRPSPSAACLDGQQAWRAINHLSLNYMSIQGPESGRALRDLLSLYDHVASSATRRQIEGVRDVNTRQITRPVPTAGPISFGRGLEVTVSLDESAFEGSGIFLLGAVLEQFIARYVSVNSFTETVIRSTDREEVMRWPARIGQRQIL